MVVECNSLSGLALESAAGGCVFSLACCHKSLSLEHSVHAWHACGYQLSPLGPGVFRRPRSVQWARWSRCSSTPGPGAPGRQVAADGFRPQLGFAVAIRAAWPWKRMDWRGPVANRALSELASGKVGGLVVHGMLSDRAQAQRKGAGCVTLAEPA